MSALSLHHPLESGHPPTWATEWGDDRYGPWVAFSVGGVAQRMRWVPPGTFWMGSPEGEEGRDADEVRHEVVLTEGLWLADTPCTQALWVAVMGENPSCFESPDRPVEQVSWDDCRRFFERLAGRVPGPAPRMPTEAEWERACRAGTDTATWLGDLEIRGACNAPLLDGIAWYGGNSGVGFDLANGHDSKGWPDKQHPDSPSGTHPVGKKAPNPLGLYDMLGNVWEWCEDWFGPYPRVRAVDPRGLGGGSDRVFRGGSWFCLARLVRAAGRDRGGPSYRHSFLGLRLARSQAAPGAEPRERSD